MSETLILVICLIVLTGTAFAVGYEIGEDKGYRSASKPKYLPPPKPVNKCCTIIGHPFGEHLCDGIGMKLGDRSGWF